MLSCPVYLVWRGHKIDSEGSELDIYNITVFPSRTKNQRYTIKKPSCFNIEKEGL